MAKEPKQNKREDAERTSLHPRTFREAVKELAESPPQRTKKADSPARRMTDA